MSSLVRTAPPVASIFPLAIRNQRDRFQDDLAFSSRGYFLILEIRRHRQSRASSAGYDRGEFHLSRHKDGWAGDGYHFTLNSLSLPPTSLFCYEMLLRHNGMPNFQPQHEYWI